MKIYSHRSDKDVDHLRFDMKMGGVVLSFRRSGEEQTMNPQIMARIIFDDTCEIDTFIMALTKLKKIAADHYGNWMASNAIGEYL